MTVKPQLEVELGGSTRVIRFGIPECLALAKRLDNRDPLQFLLGGGDVLTFCVEALFVGMQDKRAARVDPNQVMDWLGEWEGDLVDLQWDLAYLWARGQPKQRAVTLVEMLDRARGNLKLPVHQWSAAPDPPSPAG